jgi:hypothetical protein
MPSEKGGGKMSRRRSKKDAETGALFIMILFVVAILWAVSELWNTLIETGAIWFLAVGIVVALPAWWFVKRRQESNRVKDILAHRDKWGEAMCQWLIENKINSSDKRVERILARLNVWGEETCQDLIQQRIDLGMTDDMVLLALGKPNTIDQREISERSEKFRWIYGVPRQGATYVWFKDGKVTRIKR